MSNEGYKGEVWREWRCGGSGGSCVSPNERRRVRNYRTSLNRPELRSEGINVFV